MHALLRRRISDVAALEQERTARGLEKPVTRFTKVLLPAPFGPMTACRSPRRSEKLSLSKIFRPPKAIRRSTVCRTALGAHARTARFRARRPMNVGNIPLRNVATISTSRSPIQKYQ